MASDNSTASPIEIQLTKGYIAFIDACDVDLADFKWYALTPKNCNMVYARHQVPYRRNSKRTIWLLHRVILGRMLGRDLLRREQVDHINLNGLDNRRENLRLATPGQNHQNRGAQRNNISGYKGVVWDKDRRKWQSRIAVDGKRYFLGRFDTPELAHAAYCEAAKRYHGEFARTS